MTHDKTAEFNKFLIIPKDKPEECIGFIQIKKGIEILPSDHLIPVILKEKVEHFLLVKTGETPPPSPTLGTDQDESTPGMVSRFRSFISRKKIDKPERV